MIFYFLLGIFVVLLVLSLIVDSPYLQPTQFAILSLTSMILLVIETGQFWLSHIVRYFLLFISGFTLVIVPFFLLGTAVIILMRMAGEGRKERKRERVANVVIATALCLYTAFTVWGFFYLKNQNLIALININAHIALFFTANFISYGIVTCVLGFRQVKHPIQWIVVLGARLDQVDSVPQTMQRRLDKALTYYQQASTQEKDHLRFIVTGGRLDPNQSSEAGVMADYLMAKGVPRDHIIKEDSAKNTYENFQNTKALIQSNTQTGSTLVVSSQYHLVRAHFYAHLVQLPASFKGAREGLFHWPYALVREFLAYFILTKKINALYLLILIATGMLSIFY